MKFPTWLQTDGVGAVGCGALLGVFLVLMVCAVAIWMAWDSRRWCLTVMLWVQAVISAMTAAVVVMTCIELRRKQEANLPIYQPQPMQSTASSGTGAPQYQTAPFYPAHQTNKEPPLLSTGGYMGHYCPATQATQRVSFHQIISQPYAKTPNDPSGDSRARRSNCQPGRDPAVRCSAWLGSPRMLITK